VKNATSTAIATGQQYAAQAQAAIQPHVERAAQAASDLVNQATTKGALEADTTTTSSTATVKDPSTIPSTTAPLETAGVPVDTMYPSSTTGSIPAKVNAL
jgi:hypothetical protein